jgi:small GTP-binding protein
VVIVGNVSTGKTSLVQRFVKNTFNSDYKSTIGVDFEVENFTILNIPFNLQIWDTAGQERFRCIATAYYRGSKAIIVAFDLTDRESLQSVESWLNDALKANKFDEQPQYIYIVGTKNDLIVIFYFLNFCLI